MVSIYSKVTTCPKKTSPIELDEEQCIEESLTCPIPMDAGRRPRPHSPLPRTKDSVTTRPVALLNTTARRRSSSSRARDTTMPLTSTYRTSSEMEEDEDDSLAPSSMSMDDCLHEPIKRQESEAHKTVCRPSDHRASSSSRSLTSHLASSQSTSRPPAFPSVIPLKIGVGDGPSTPSQSPLMGWQHPSVVPSQSPRHKDIEMHSTSLFSRQPSAESFATTLESASTPAVLWPRTPDLSFSDPLPGLMLPPRCGAPWMPPSAHFSLDSAPDSDVGSVPQRAFRPEVGPTSPKVIYVPVLYHHRCKRCGEICEPVFDASAPANSAPTGTQQNNYMPVSPPPTYMLDGEAGSTSLCQSARSSGTGSF